MVRWFLNDKRLGQLVRERLPEMTRLREDLIVAANALKDALGMVKDRVSEMERLRAEGYLTEADHLKALRAFAHAIDDAEGNLTRALRLTKRYTQRRLD